MRTCPVCGSPLPGGEPSKDAASFTEHIRAQWADKRVRIAAIALAVVVVGAIGAVVITALLQDVALRENARAVAEGETALIKGSDALRTGTCTMSTDAEWLFVEADQLLIARNRTEDGWVLERSDDGGRTWNTVLNGSGTLRSAYVVHDLLFYSLEEGASASTLRSQSMSGAFSEYASAVDVAAISATEEMVVTKSTGGKIGWLNIGSGIWHDLQGQLEAAVGQDAVRVDEVQAFGAQAIASTHDGQIVIIDVNSGDAFIAGDQEG